MSFIFMGKIVGNSVIHRCLTSERQTNACFPHLCLCCGFQRHKCLFHLLLIYGIITYCTTEALSWHALIFCDIFLFVLLLFFLHFCTIYRFKKSLCLNLCLLDITKSPLIPNIRYPLYPRKAWGEGKALQVYLYTTWHTKRSLKVHDIMHLKH